MCRSPMSRPGLWNTPSEASPWARNKAMRYHRRHPARPPVSLLRHLPLEHGCLPRRQSHLSCLPTSALLGAAQCDETFLSEISWVSHSRRNGRLWREFVETQVGETLALLTMPKS